MSLNLTPEQFHQAASSVATYANELAQLSALLHKYVVPVLKVKAQPGVDTDWSKADQILNVIGMGASILDAAATAHPSEADPNAPKPAPTPQS